MKKIFLMILFCSFSLSQATTMKDIELSARNGNADAQYKMGLIYEFGVKTQADQSQAEFWYKKADKKDKIRATTRLAVMFYDDGELKKAMPYLKKSILKKEPLSMVYYGKFLLSKNNKDLAKKYYKIGMDNDIPQAFYEQGVLLGDYYNDYFNAYKFTMKAKLKGFKKADSKIKEYKDKLTKNEIFAANKSLKYN